jgi:hypothetical protein
MKNLAALLTRKSVVDGINTIIRTSPKLRPATKYQLVYKNKSFPPKEVIRFAARELGITNFSNYRIHGGESIHKKLRKLGFVVETFRDTKISSSISQKKEKRVSRITWNDNGWILPSGTFGKSSHKGSHESKFGYGHEEWLFDFSKLIDGYHYGFLEPIRKQQDAYTYNSYDVWLYTINGQSKQRFFIGEIKNLEVIDEEEAEKVKGIYREKGWMKEMEEQIKNCGANPKGFSNWVGVNLFNVKFKPRDLYMNDPYLLLPAKHIIYTQSRYAFVKYTEDYETSDTTGKKFEFISQDDNTGRDQKIKTKVHYRAPKPVQIEYIHEAISKSLTASLRKVYGAKNVTREHPAGYEGNRIDIVVNQSKQLTFYEIKTYTSIKTCVREAMGQLLEYCYYPEDEKAKELIVVSQWPADDKTKKYFQQLRQKLKINVYYQSYDLQSKMLSDRY